MLITGNQITELDLLANVEPKNIRGGCYYLRIHSIIPAGEDTKTYDPQKPKTIHTLEPGGLAWVISQEKFQITEPSVTALVTLRSGFTKRGMLALDVGLVDANFFGPIGSLVINFSRKPIRLDAGEAFFRVLFFNHEEAEEGQIPPKQEFDHESYARKILADMVGDFSNTFLQTAEMEERIRKDLKENIIERLEPDLLDKLASRFFSKHWRNIALCIIFVVLSFFGLSYFTDLGSYLHTEEEIQQIVEDQIEALETRALPTAPSE